MPSNSSRQARGTGRRGCEGITTHSAEPKTGHKHRDGSNKLTPEAIQMAVTRLAKLIDLPLRT
jgi:hypothetical protein